MLDEVRGNAQADPAKLGDQTLLPSMLPLAAKATINQTFGGTFADELGEDTGSISGPGQFLPATVSISSASPSEGRAVTRSLSEVRDAVAREWSNAKRKALEAERIEALLKRYNVTIENTDKGETR